MRLLLHPFTQDAKKNPKRKKRKRKKKIRRRKRTQTKKKKTHIFKNEDAIFQERRCEKTKTKTQILRERCQLSSGEYCRCSLNFPS